MIATPPAGNDADGQAQGRRWQRHQAGLILAFLCGVIHDGYRLFHAEDCPARDPAVSPDDCTCGGLAEPLHRTGVPMCWRWYERCGDRRPWDATA